MSDYVLDASALLALLNAEKGAEIVQGRLSKAVISTVNLAEVVTRLTKVGMPDDQIRDVLSYLGLEAIPFDEEQAFQTGFLSALTQPFGLSLGDRACLALAKTMAATAVTADQAWNDMKLGIDIQPIR